MIGPVEMVLFAASSAKDTDFFVRVCDVYPDGRSIFLTEGIIRARYRNSHEGDSTELLEPGEVAEYRIRCYPMANVFERGHRIRVDVTSSSFPRFSRNLNNGEDVGTEHPDRGRAADRPAHGRLPLARAAAGRAGLVRADEMPSIAVERRLAGTNVLPLKGTLAAPLPEHVRVAVLAALGEHEVSPPVAGPHGAAGGDRAEPAGAGRPGARDPGHERRHARAQPHRSARCSSPATR